MKKTISIIILTFVIFFASMQLYCQKRIDILNQRRAILDIKIKAANLSFLVHNHNKELQDSLVYLLQGDLVWMDKMIKNDEMFYEICIGWKDDLFRKAIKETKKERIKKVFRRLDKICTP
jgi:hypothetical protein